MPQQTAFKWANSGQPIDLMDMPLAGLLEVNEVKQRYAKYISLRTRYRHLMLSEGILAAKRILDVRGVKDAKAAWDAFIPTVAEPSDLRHLTWSEDDFPISLQSWLKTSIYDRLGADGKDDAERMAKAHELLLGQSKELMGEFEEMKTKVVDFDYRLIMLEFYWRLYNSGLKSIMTPAGEVPLNWSPLEKEATMKLLSTVVDTGDLARLRLPAEPKPMLNPDAYAPLSEADVTKKS